MSDKKKRSPIERIIVWGVIGLMLAIVAVEYNAKTKYDKAFAASEKMKTPTIGEFKAAVAGETVGEVKEGQYKSEEVPITFFSLFKDYRLMARLRNAEEGTPVDDRIVDVFYTPVALADEQKNRTIVPTDATGDVELPTSPMGAAAGGGGGRSKGDGGGDAGEDGEHGGDDEGGQTSDSPQASAQGANGGPGAGAGGGGPRGPGGGGPGGGRGGRGGRAPRGMPGIAMNEDIQSKLKLTAEQVEKIGEVVDANRMDFGAMQGMEREAMVAAFMKSRTDTEAGIKEVVDAEQFESLQKMTWVQEGAMAMFRKEVAEAVGLTEEQTGKLADIRANMGRGAPPTDEVMEILTDEQKTAWDKLIEGVEAPPAPAWGGGGGGRRGGGSPGGPGGGSPGGPGGGSNRKQRPDIEE